MTTQIIKFLDRNPPIFSIDQACAIAEALFGVTGEFSLLISERDQNFRIQVNDQPGATHPHGYVLKFSNAEEDAGVIDFQTQALLHIAERAPELPVPRVVQTKVGGAFTTVQASDGQTHIVRLLTYLPGTLLRDVEKTPTLCANLGRFMGRLDIALQGFFHPHARHELLWDLTRCTTLAPHAVHIEDPIARQHVEQIFDTMSTTGLPLLKRMRHQVIHADGHAENVLVATDNPEEIAGILDFGDMHFAPPIIEVVLAANIKGLTGQELLGKLCGVTAGFDSVYPLEEQEIDLLYDLLLTRLAMTSTIVAWRNAMTPDQPRYLDGMQHLFARTIADLKEMGRATVCDAVRRAVRFPVYAPKAGLPDQTEEILARREKVLGKHLAYFYSQPVHLERGEGVWLYGMDGTRYLDAYNNVPVVGHCHPEVVRAVQRQTAALNTNTRYLYRNILDYAERLVTTLDESLSVCAFVNSGSEANDIAWRIAKHITGNEGGIVIEKAYHGITDAVTALTPQKYQAGKTPSHIQTLISPDPYGGPYRYGEADLAGKYAADADRAIADLATKGLKPAAFMIDSLFVSNGSPDVPDGYLQRVVEKVRAAGGLIIGDEVQAGFGRSGTHLWGHQHHNILPDIVTLGKPVANGYPMGVVITRPEILNQFGGDIGVFSTFGGNPVACAAALAVLDIMKREGLVANAFETGNYLRDGIRSLMDRYSIIGDVRGRGLLVGVELVRDRETRDPAREETARLVDLMRDGGVLIGAGGRARNVLKIRPSMVFRKEHADILVKVLGQSLGKI